MLQEFTDTAIDFAEDGGHGGKSGTTNTLEEGDAPVIRLVHLIIQEAVHHARQRHPHRAVRRPGPDPIPDRRRAHGARHRPPAAPGSIVSRLKIMGSIDIAEKRRPQDGRIKILVAGKDIDLRVSILPTTHGQSVVMRILDRDNIKVGLRDLGFGDDDWKRFSQLIKRPNGILLVTGPTGSGKTTTLYAALERAEPARREDHHGRGPGRVLPARREPVRGQGQDRDDLRADHPGHAPAESEHPPGRRNPRPGDG